MGQHEKILCYFSMSSSSTVVLCIYRPFFILRENDSHLNLYLKQAVLALPTKSCAPDMNILGCNTKKYLITCNVLP